MAQFYEEERLMCPPKKAFENMSILTLRDRFDRTKRKKIEQTIEENFSNRAFLKKNSTHKLNSN